MALLATRALNGLNIVLACLVAALAAACSNGGGGDPSAGTQTPVPATVTSPMAVSMPLAGALTLDGQPFDADFLGARVINAGLPAACQNSVPGVFNGRYEVEVTADAEVRGCGAPGAEVLLWVFVDERYLFSEQTLRWSASDETVEFDASFSSAEPLGASTPVTEFKGHIFDRDGRDQPGGTVIEAFAGETLCGVTSMRHGGVTEGLYTLIVAGPEAVPACAEGATLTFRLDGEPAVETAINDLGAGSEGHELDLTLL